MKKTVIVTDSNTVLRRDQAETLGIHIVHMPILIGGEVFFEDINLSHDDFYEKLLSDTPITTSQPTIDSVTMLWEELLRDYEEIVHIPTSRALSAACETAQLLAKEYGGRVHVVSNQRISVTQRQSVLDAVALANAGWDARRIKEYLEAVKAESSAYIMVGTLKYLKKGGRITPAAAAIGTMLRINPVLQLRGEKLEPYAKARGVKQARKIMIAAIRKDFETRFSDVSDPAHMWLQMAYSYDLETALDFKAEVERAFPGFDIHMDPLSLSNACHTGPGMLGLTCTRKLDCL